MALISGPVDPAMRACLRLCLASSVAAASSCNLAHAVARPCAGGWCVCAPLGCPRSTRGPGPRRPRGFRARCAVDSLLFFVSVLGLNREQPIARCRPRRTVPVPAARAVAGEGAGGVRGPVPARGEGGMCVVRWPWRAAGEGWGGGGGRRRGHEQCRGLVRSRLPRITLPGSRRANGSRDARGARPAWNPASSGRRPPLDFARRRSWTLISASRIVGFCSITCGGPRTGGLGLGGEAGGGRLGRPANSPGDRGEATQEGAASSPPPPLWQTPGSLRPCGVMAPAPRHVGVFVADSAVSGSAFLSSPCAPYRALLRTVALRFSPPCLFSSLLPGDWCRRRRALRG